MVTITDRDVCLSVAGGGRRELTDKSISPALAQIMEGRQLYQHQPGQPRAGGRKAKAACPAAVTRQKRRETYANDSI